MNGVPLITFEYVVPLMINEKGPVPAVELKVRLIGLPSQTEGLDAVIVPFGAAVVVTVTLFNGVPVFVHPLLSVMPVRS